MQEPEKLPPVPEANPALKKPSSKQKAARNHSGKPNLPVSSPKTKSTFGPKKSGPFPIVGIGASAGGLEASTRLLSKLPADIGMAFILIQHLDPAHESMLSEILSRKTMLPVQEARNGMKVEPNHVYVIPRDATMVIAGGILKLTSRQKDSGKHLPVDRFLHSLAEDQKSKAIGIILSGTAADGALGIRAVKAEGGLTFAQDEASAKFPGMPQSAIDTGCVDFVLPPEKIAQELAALRHHPYVSQGDERFETIDAIPKEEDGLVKIFRALRTATGVDFTYYKPATIKRRILRRLAVHRLEHIGEYARYLQRHPEEINRLYEDLLISVTGFFRDPEAFQSLKTKAFRRLLNDRAPNSAIRIWVPGCSSGEEAYSIAICLLETLAEAESEFDIQIFGSDISDMAIEKARAGVYPENIRQDVSLERLGRFFVKIEKNGYQVSKRVREMCVFAKQNLINDPPFSKMDLISCRNLLIYLDVPLQEKALSILSYALKPGGFLLLGKSEGIGTQGTSLELEDRKQKLYSKKLTEAAPRPQLPAPSEQAPLTAGGQLQEDTGRQVLPMAREGLAPHLRSAIELAKKRGGPIRMEGLHLAYGARFTDFDLEVIPITSAQVSERLWLVLFQEIAAPEAKGKQKASAKAGKAAPKKQTLTETSLRSELSAAQGDMQSLLEEFEATNEELQSANEEIQSSNEELQSTNEELQTSKEELQASNEELLTVNEELQNRNAELLQANNDLANLFSNANMPLVMVGNDLRIRRFTPAAANMMSLISADVGRPIGHINPGIVGQNLEQEARSVIQTLTSKEAEVQDRAGRWHLLRIRPYRTGDNKIEGAVLVLVDIDELKRSLVLSRDLRAILDGVRECLVMLDGKDRVKIANQYFYKTFRTTVEQTEGQVIYEVARGQLDLPSIRSLLGGVRSHDTRWQNVRFDIEQPDKTKKTILASALRLPESQMVLLAARDLTDL